MPSFTTQIAALQGNGPVIEIRIAIAKPLYQYFKTNNLPIPQPIKAMALIDTGATSSVVNPDIIRKLGLNPIGSVKVSTPTCSNVDCNQYMIAFILPNLIVESTEVIGLPLQGQPIQCLIGRDILKNGILIYNGKAEVITFSV